MKFIRIYGLLSILVLNSFIAIGQKNNKSPNIILILADDLGYGDLGCYGSIRIKTPHLDKMANEGLKFTQFYAGSAVCTPTRVSVLTGNYPLRYSVSTHFNDREMYLNNNMLTIPKVLKQHGYVSKHIGKWHLGGLNEVHIKNRANSMPGPIEHGFDSYLAMIEDPLYRGPAMREKRLYKDAGKHLTRDDKIQPINNNHWTDIKFDEAIEFIENSNENKQPFFLNLWLDSPHAPYEASNEGVMKQYQDRTNGQDLLYRGMVSQLDQGVGAILNTLKKLKIEQNTLVIFTSDNGPAYLGSPAHFKGRKTDFHEGGIRVPMIAWWPKTIKKNQVTHEISNTIDLLPTFASVAGVKISDKVKIDGVNISPLLIQNSKLEERTLFWEIATRYNKSGNYVNVTDIRINPAPNQIARHGKWKLLALEGVAKELYNVDEDPYERWNLIKSYPKIANKLRNELMIWLNEPRQAKPY